MLILQVLQYCVVAIMIMITLLIGIECIKVIFKKDKKGE